MSYPFISYSGREGARIAGAILATWSKLATQSGLRGSDTKPFMDSHSLNVGDKWEERILGALRECGCLFAVVTEEYILSPFAQQETGVVIGRDKRIFPILGKGMTAEKLPGFLKGRQAISFTDKDKIVQMLDDVIREQAAIVLDVDNNT